MKKILMLMILMIIIISCSARDIELWNESGRRLEKEYCYRDYKGYVYCEDR